ncbi:MAG: nucleotidyltransferase domain-containing protein [Candidatus Eremiobacteraeota bacterium]|nr:nucleotidyltransferase domain-containing protein [Candidatus Eremiobacteraeota bacterium]
MDSPLERALKIIIHVANPDKVILFGSHASGKGNPESDYDFLVLKKGIKKQRKLAQEIYLNLTNIGAPVDVIVSNLEKYERLKTDPYMIYSEAAGNGRVVYEKSG